MLAWTYWQYKGAKADNYNGQPSATIIAESPRKGRQLPFDFRFRFLGLPHADLQYSLAEWNTNYVATALEADARLICGMVREEPPASYLQFIRELPVTSSTEGKQPHPSGS
jgi:hypothetical protein